MQDERKGCHNTPPLDPAEVFRPTPDRSVIGIQGEIHESVASTMDVARQRLMEDAGNGYTVIADHQSAGRGRTGSWECPPALGILMSVVLRVGLPASQQRLVVLAGSVACAEALRSLGVPAQIKWPNDIVTVSPRPDKLEIRKLAGLIVERILQEQGTPAYILGLGLNVNQNAEDLVEKAALTPTSMKLAGGREFDRAAVTAALLDQMDIWYRRIALGQNERVLARWRSLSCLLGRQIGLEYEGRPMVGKVVGIRGSGELIFEDATGTRFLLADEKTQLML